MKTQNKLTPAQLSRQTAVWNLDMTKMRNFIHNLSHEELLITFQLIIEMEIIISEKYQSRIVKSILNGFIRIITKEYEDIFELLDTLEGLGDEIPF